MENIILNSNVYISLVGESSIFDVRAMKEIDKTFKGLFEDINEKISDLRTEDITEIIYEIKSPIMREDGLMIEFYERLEVLLESLKDYNPHFTQIKGGFI